jgi:ankyrin repeat protein
VDCDGETPLHVLIWRGDAEGALLLIENKNEKRVINALLEAGARTDIVSEFGQTQAEKARQYGVSLREDT